MNGIDIITCTSDHILAIEPREDLGCIFMDKGPALTIVKDGQPVACGGLRLGIADFWTVIQPEYARTHARELLELSRVCLMSMVKETGIWAGFACQKSPNAFLKHLGFKQITIPIFTTGPI